MDIANKKGFIFDVDGTLYNQKQMRVRMLFTLLGYFLFHPRQLKELMAIYHFRKHRENEKYRAMSMDGLFQVVADQLRIDKQTVAAAIQKWMFDVPLEIIQKCAYDEVIAFANRMHHEGKRIIIYSDYPAAEKLQKLNMPGDEIFVSGDEHLPELKPSLSAMQHILQTAQIPAEELVFIGDRDEKDGASARLAGMPYCDVQQLRKWLKNTNP